MTPTASPAPSSADASRPGGADGGVVRVAYLGPEGTFSEQALRSQADLVAGELVAQASISDVLHAVTSGVADVGLVPIENAIEGSVNVTLDSLVFDHDLLIQREVVIPIVMCLLAPPGVAVDDVTTVVSMPVATAQCRSYLTEHLPDAERESVNSTAKAAALVAERNDGRTAAIANARAGEVHGLEVLAADIEDHPDNQTRFVLVARNGVPTPTGHDKTSIVVFQRADVPGSLLSILSEFAARAINLTLLLSRPTKQGLGDYCFFIEFEGHVADELVADALRSLKTKHAEVLFLGSYHAAGENGADVRAEAEAAAVSAERWLQEIRGAIGRSDRSPH